MQNMYVDFTNIYYILAGIGILNIITILIVLQIKNILGNENNVTTTTENNVASVVEDNTEIPNRQEIIAAVSAVIAEELGTSASNIRILSFKKI